MASSSDPAVLLDGLGKQFRLTHDRNWTLKATVLAGHRTRYEEFWALRGVDLDIPHGSTFGIIGGNGSGKSTLLKVLAGILRPDEGAATVNGRLSVLLELGAGFHPELTGRENVYLNGAILGFTSKEIRRRFDDIVGFAELDRFIDEPVRNYSSGMYVRLGFSVPSTSSRKSCSSTRCWPSATTRSKSAAWTGLPNSKPRAAPCLLYTSPSPRD